MNSGINPLNTQNSYIESNFEIGFLSSIFHTFILIFFAELGDKTFIMLFILQLRTNKVTIFYSALLAEILMNSLACFWGFLINYLLYKNLIDYICMLFFVIYGIFLILWGFKKTNDETFETEFEMIEEILKSQKTKRTSSMILGVDEDDSIDSEENKEDKYNLENVNIVNQKKYVPDIKKELTIIPEDDISREDSIIDNSTLLLSGKKQKNSDENDNDFILGNKNNSSSNPFSLKLRITKQVSSEKKINNEKYSFENNNIITSDFKSEENIKTIEENNEDNKDNDNNKENNEENKENENKIKYKSRYYLDYIDKDIDTDKPNIDTSVFGTIFFSICLSEFGDRTQLISLSSASIFHFWGSLLGSCTALFCSCLIGVYFSKPLVKNMKQKFIDFILGILFLIAGIQIYIFKLNNKFTI
jgi:putative Ca2+/H+ antiporter (TMEM165/GDT1 family)